jgi:protein gp37
VKDFSKPEFFPERLKALESKKPQVVFMDSMSDIADWEPEWTEQIYRACEDNPQHKYLFLTKRPIYAVPYPFYLNFHENKNWWLGVSVCSQENLIRCQELFGETTEDTNRFVSIEPIQDYIDMRDNIYYANWLICGSETGNRKDKIIPEKSWIDKIVYDCRKHNIPIFMKESLRSLMGDDFIQEYPWPTAQCAAPYRDSEERQDV